jgi:hypothetical protein
MSSHTKLFLTSTPVMVREPPFNVMPLQFVEQSPPPYTPELNMEIGFNYF